MSDSLKVHADIVDTMIELANRDSAHEAAMLRVARAGEIDEVVKHIMRNRKYLKTHTPAARATAKQSQPARRRKKPERASDGAGNGTNSGTATADASN